MVDRDELFKAITDLPKEDQIWLLNQIVYRLWPEFKDKPVSFFDPSTIWDDLDNKEVDRVYEELYKRNG